MKWLLSIVGVVLVLLGGLWFLQGTNVVPVGFMAGHVQYALLGIAAVVVGLGLVLFANRRPRGAPSAD
jgi:hypothetical protein